MLSLLNELPGYWTEGAIRSLDGFRRGLSDSYPIEDDPPPNTPYTVVYEGGKVSLRHYRAQGSRHATPLLVCYALIKRPYILDLMPGRSVVETLIKNGFEVYLIDWIPPTRADSWRGFDAYVNQDIDNAARAVQLREGVEQISLLGYCFGGMLSTMYTALHPETIKNFIALTLPFDMSVRDIPMQQPHGPDQRRDHRADNQDLWQLPGGAHEDGVYLDGADPSRAGQIRRALPQQADPRLLRDVRPVREAG